MFFIVRLAQKTERSFALAFILSGVVQATIALFIVVDPFGIVPIVLGLTKGMDPGDRKRTLNTALLTGFVLLVLFAIAGDQLLTIFGITVYSFKIAGGILLLLLSMQILLRGQPMVGGSLRAEDIGVVPIAIPLLVGPGAITTTIVTLQTAGILSTLVSIAVVILVTFLIFRYIDKINSLLGSRGSAVLSMLMAIFIAAIAIQFILTGIQFYYPS